MKAVSKRERAAEGGEPTRGRSHRFSLGRVFHSSMTRISRSHPSVLSVPVPRRETALEPRTDGRTEHLDHRSTVAPASDKVGLHI
jgi:hypothetical protein